MNLNQTIVEFIDGHMDEFITINESIHSHPETAYQEYFASELLENTLQEYGFAVQRGIGQLPTAFKATKKGQADGPSIAFICEYDALPSLGHGCGHNLIAAISLAAGLATSTVMEHVAGRLMVIGTPGEESGGGKIKLIEQGIFEEVDCVMMFHPFHQTMVDDIALARIHLRIEFFGKEAHAAAFPHLGINALEGVIQTYNQINGLRGHLKDDVRIHGIITDGGVAVNIVPKFAAAEFSIRCLHDDDLDYVVKRVYDCANASALSTGCQVKIKEVRPRYQEVITNRALAKQVKTHLEKLGEKVQSCAMDCGVASTDMGNLTHHVPGIHGHISLGKGLKLHTEAFKTHAVGDGANHGLNIAAKALALTAVDIWQDPQLYQQIQEEFKHRDGDKDDTEE